MKQYCLDWEEEEQSAVLMGKDAPAFAAVGRRGDFKSKQNTQHIVSRNWSLQAMRRGFGPRIYICVYFIFIVIHTMAMVLTVVVVHRISFRFLRCLCERSLPRSPPSLHRTRQKKTFYVLCMYVKVRTANTYVGTYPAYIPTFFLRVGEEEGRNDDKVDERAGKPLPCIAKMP
ncbi:hypothetical protein BZA05DRAFT_61784 [Tricharina praecox]|uniref:uncharacterized protein n=1 Tax=Tricharina praecox TaxID=43433 RepID=UPI002220B078|nr:uncharacterized protein BZA05DRAFT_61784 [Tricharina praecox]KAI5850721.1 hypothetical protein BZA05DRAFT_61784 [Tricharina praecox]